MESQASEFTIRDIGPVLTRRKWVLAACIVLCVLMGWLITYRSPKVYSATSKLLFNRPSYAVLLSDTSPTAPTLEDKGTQVYLLGSGEVTKKAESLLRSQQIDISAKQIRSALKFKDVENTDIIEVSAESTNPDMCQMIANATVDAFVQYKRIVRSQNVQEGIAALTQQLQTAKSRLKKAEDELARFKRDNQFFDPKKQTEQALEQVNKLESEVALSTPIVEEAVRRAEYLKKQLDSQTRALASGIIRNDEVMTALQTKLKDKELELLSAELIYTDKFPNKLSVLREERDQIYSRLQTEILNILKGRAGSPVEQSKLASSFAEAEANRIGQVAKLDIQRSLLDQARYRLLAAPDKERELIRLTRATTVAEDIYTNLLTNLEKAQVDRTRQADTVVVAEYAVKPDPKKPIRPDARRNLTISLLIGAIVGAFAAFLLEYVDDTVRTPEDVKRFLDLSVLGAIPVIPEGERLVSRIHPKSPVAEAYRTLRSNISFARVDETIRTIVLTSASIAEGKSLTSANLALTMAQEGKRVLLIDADLRHPVQHELFDVDGAIGLTDVLTGSVPVEQAIIPIPDVTMGLLPCGPLPPNPAELLGSEQMRQLISSLQQSWDTILMDTPPCTLVADAAVLASRTDGAIQVIDSETVGRQLAISAKETLVNARANLLGVVLNRVQKTSGKYSYYYYYYYQNEQGTPGQLPRLTSVKKQESPSDDSREI